MARPVRKVLLVGKGPPDRGGIAAYLHALLGAADRLPHDLRLLNVTREEVPAAGRLTRANVVRTLVDAFRLMKAARSAEIVHIHTALVPTVTMARASLLAAVARARRTRVIVHVHSGRVQLWLSGRPRRALARFLLAPAHVIVAVSRGAERALSSALPPHKVALVENCVDAAAFAVERIAHDPPRILYAGLLTPRKGVLDLIAASEILHHRGVRHEVLVAGGTPDEGPDAAAEVVAAAGSRVRLLGPIRHEDMADVYRQADVFCLPSWWEAIPLALLEAMAAGLPVVASRVGDVERILEDGRAGRLIEPRDPAALAAALEGLLAEPDMRRRLGRAGRELVRRKWDLGRMLTELDGIYVGSPPKTRR